ncbi:MAG TPA: tetratricopeptide repeat protein, partial [Hyphomicrobium sp.]|nr:tetratricopeptide repeat protein [Hyphomicrobium sp.]
MSHLETLAAAVAAALLVAATPLLAQDASPAPPPAEGVEPLKPLPAPHNNLPPVPPLPGAVFPGGNPAEGNPGEGMGPAPGDSAEGLKPLPAPHNNLPPVPALPGAVFPGDPHKQAGKPAGKQSREELLAELLSHLAKAHDASQAESISEAIQSLWLQSGSDTVGVLMGRSAKAISDQKNALALKLLDAVVELAPDYAEGWNRRAYVFFLDNDYENAVEDLRRALALEPNHFKALDGLARILRETGQKKAALKAYRELLKINPFQEGAKKAADELSVEVEGQGI